MTEEIQAWTDGELALRIVLLKTLADLVLEEFKAAKAIAADQYPKGASIPARTDSADGDVKLGRATKSDPKPVAKVTDEAILDAYILAEEPSKVGRRVEFNSPGELMALLKDLGRKDLFTVVEEVPDWLRQQFAAQAVSGKAIPGVTVTTPRGTVSARSERAAVELVRSILAAAPIQLLGIEA